MLSGVRGGSSNVWTRFLSENWRFITHLLKNMLHTCIWQSGYQDDINTSFPNANKDIQVILANLITMLELTIKPPKVGTNSSFLKESSIFATFNTCVSETRKRDFVSLYFMATKAWENFEFFSWDHSIWGAHISIIQLLSTILFQ